MAPNRNLALLFKAIPTTMPVPGEHLAVEDIGFDPSTPAPPGGLIVENLYASFEPYLRGRMRGPEVKSYVPGFEPGKPITTMCLGKILKSDVPDYAEGDTVCAFMGVQEYSVIPAAMIPHIRLRKADPEHGPKDVRDYLGALGGPGLTAYASLYEIGKPKRGETIFISSAAGAVGQVVGQLAKREGLKVIGSVGSDEKLGFIEKELGFDGGFNYKKEKPRDALKRLAPQGIDIYFENVGGEHLEAALQAMNDHGRIIACGMISQYNVDPSEAYGVKNLMFIIQKQITMRGFIVTSPDMMAYMGEHQKNVTKWLNSGEMVAKTHEDVGMEKAADACVGVFQGKNFGKAVLKIKV